MKIAVLNNCVPFLQGGAEHLADALTAKFLEYGHEALLVRIPFRWDPPDKIVDHMLACRMMRFPNVDRIIGLKFPAYYVPHPDKVIWLLHQFRQAYDLWGTPYQCVPDSVEGRAIRSVIVNSDNTYLPEARKIFTNSSVTSDRLRRYNGLESEVLYPPLLKQAHFSCEEYGDFIFAPGRINSMKRQRLLVESMRHCRSKVRLILAGSAETPDEAQAIERLIIENHLEERVQFVNRFITESEKAEWFSRALGSAYIPYDEDSYGYVTLESYLSKKPVITCTDSGGIEALVKDKITGTMSRPDPKALAEAMDMMFEDKQRTKRMGEAGHDLVLGMRINWDRVIESLTA